MKMFNRLETELTYLYNVCFCVSIESKCKLKQTTIDSCVGVWASNTSKQEAKEGKLRVLGPSGLNSDAQSQIRWK